MKTLIESIFARTTSPSAFRDQIERAESSYTQGVPLVMQDRRIIKKMASESPDIVDAIEDCVAGVYFKRRRYGKVTYTWAHHKDTALSEAFCSDPWPSANYPAASLRILILRALAKIEEENPEFAEFSS